MTSNHHPRRPEGLMENNKVNEDERCHDDNDGHVDSNDDKMMTRNNSDDDGREDPSIKSLLIPWSLIVLFALTATVISVLYSSNNVNDFSTTDVDDSSPSSEESSWFDQEEVFDDEDPTTTTTIMPQFMSRMLSAAAILNDVHKPLLPLAKEDIIGFVLATLGLMVAAGGGIGGGGILVPIYILVMRFNPKYGIPLSNITVLGGAFANTILNVRKRHPLADRPMVDWDLILVMEPLTIAGALIGAFLNKLLPEELLVFMLVVLLSYTANNTLRKATKMYKKETRIMQERENEMIRLRQKEEEEEEEEVEESLLEHMEMQDGEDEIRKNSAKSVDDPEREEQLNQILEEERTMPMGNITVLVVMFIVVLFINLMKGGGAFKSPLGITCGSTNFWIANGAMLSWIIFISILARQYLVKRYEQKQACGYKYVDGDIQWDGRATVVYPAICALAGFFAGMFGVGGGIVKGPLMLAMGVHPAVSSASSACMILFTSFTATTSFIVFGLLVPDYAIVCFIIGFLATLVGQIGLNYLMRKNERNSYIAFSIGGVVLLSAILMTIQSLVAMAEKKHHTSGGVCGKVS